jgi:hypothetical protein
MLEQRFHPTRMWRFDMVWPELSIAVEVEGLTHGGGRHQRVVGYSNDCEKYNEAALLGWTLIRVTQLHIRSGEAVKWIDRAIRAAVSKHREGAVDGTHVRDADDRG